MSEVEEVRMVLEDQPLVSEAVATLVAEVVLQTEEVRQNIIKLFFPFKKSKN